MESKHKLIIVSNDHCQICLKFKNSVERGLSEYCSNNNISIQYYNYTLLESIPQRLIPVIDQRNLPILIFDYELPEITNPDSMYDPKDLDNFDVYESSPLRLSEITGWLTKTTIKASLKKTKYFMIEKPSSEFRILPSVIVLVSTKDMTLS